MKTSGLAKYAPALLVVVFSFIIKSYDPLRSPVIAALDPWGWVTMTREFLLTHRLNSFFTLTGYPPTFMLVVAFISNLSRLDPYDVIRYLPILSALNVIPIYLLAFEIFHSHKVASLASLLSITSRLYFMRTSIGVPEGLAQFFLTFALLFLLKSISTPRWKNRFLAIAMTAVGLLYYHFTILILLPFIVVLPFALWPRSKNVAREIAIMNVPAFLLTGLIWYFQVLPSMLRFYVSIAEGTYAKPSFEYTVGGIIRILAYSVAKSGAVTLAEIGYVITSLTIVGIAYALLTKKHWRRMGVGVLFLGTYLAVLAALTLLARIVYNLEFAAIAGDISVYFLSWLTIPASIVSAKTAQVGLNQIGGTLQRRFRLMEISRMTKVITILAIILLVSINLNSFDYYKAPAGGSPIPDSFYYYKPLTDQEYYALRYIREHTPIDSLVLVVGLEPTILAAQEVVAGRTIIAISNLTIVGQAIQVSGEVAYSDAQTANLSLAVIQNNTLSNQHIYVVTGIRNVSVDVARSNGKPPPIAVQNEHLLLNQLTSLGRTEQFYQNEQITVVQALSVQVQY